MGAGKKRRGAARKAARTVRKVVPGRGAVSARRPKISKASKVSKSKKLVLRGAKRKPSPLKSAAGRDRGTARAVPRAVQGAVPSAVPRGVPSAVQGALPGKVKAVRARGPSAAGAKVTAAKAKVMIGRVRSESVGAGPADRIPRPEVAGREPAGAGSAGAGGPVSQMDAPPPLPVPIASFTI